VRLREGLARTVQHYQSLRNTDPNAWFTPRNAVPRSRVLQPAQEIEVSDEDLLAEEQDIDAGWLGMQR
jgi:hypothetical protein